MSSLLLMTPLAKRLSEVRVSRGLSRRSLSLQAGLTDSVVGQIERGDIADPSTSALSAIAGVLGVSIDWLVNGETASAPEVAAA